MSTPADAPTDLDRLYAYAAWMLGDRAAALAALRSALASAGPGPFDARLPALRAAVLAHRSARRTTPARQRERLDQVLRTGTTVEIRLGNSSVRAGSRTLPVLLTGFMQSCLVAAAQTLPPAQREAFVLLVVLGLPEAQVLALQGETARGFSSTKSRMLQALDDYLGPRCGHLHAHNPCHCPNRLQLALDQGFVELPEHEQASEGYPPGTFADLRQLFAVLPPLVLAPAVRAGLGG